MFIAARFIHTYSWSLTPLYTLPTVPLHGKGTFFVLDANNILPVKSYLRQAQRQRNFLLDYFIYLFGRELSQKFRLTDLTKRQHTYGIWLR
jgi:hypothetical protein